MFYKLNLRCKKKKFDKKKDISTCQSLEYNLPLVNAKNGDNGVMYYGRFSDWESADYCIDIVNDGAVSTGNVYPQPQETGVLYNAYLIKGIDESFHNEFVIIYTAQALQKSIKLKYGYDNKATWEKVKNNTLVLPSINDLPCTKFMESYIRELEQERIRELDAYLRAIGLNNYELTPEEGKCIQFMHSTTVIPRLQTLEDDFIKNGGRFKEFRIGNLFTSSNGYKDIQKKHISSSIDDNDGILVVSSGEYNLGIIGTTNLNAKVFERNTLTVDMFGNVNFRDHEYKMVTHARVFSLRPREAINKYQGLYIQSNLNFLKKKFSYNNMCSFEKIKEDVILLPSYNDKLAFDYMESYIRELEQERIRKLYAYLRATGLMIMS